MNASLLDLSLADLLLLTGQTEKPMLATAAVDVQTFRKSIDLVLGRRRWSDVAAEALESGNVRDALLARVRGRAGGEVTPPEVEATLQARWNAIRAEISSLRARAADLPTVKDAGEFGQEVLAIAHASKA